jgi:hypothetical protein
MDLHEHVTDCSLTTSARDALTIFVEGEEVPGVIVYGLFPHDSRPAVEFPAKVWPSEPEPDSFRLVGDAWLVLLWEIAVDVWPTGEQWRTAMQVTLKAMTDQGARVAWVGAEGVPFCDPPQLFSPDCMSGGVLAWMTDTGDFGCEVDPDAPLARVADDELLELRRHAHGLADAT